MTDRQTNSELDFTFDQVLDALRNDGWNIPTTPVPTPSIESGRLIVKWEETVVETPTP
jgi:hypothetical protein